MAKAKTEAEAKTETQTQEVKQEPRIFILVDTSYWIFYRYFAIIQWWGHSNPETPLTNPYENEEFVEKFLKTFSEAIRLFYIIGKQDQFSSSEVCKIANLQLQFRYRIHQVCN